MNEAAYRAILRRLGVEPARAGDGVHTATPNPAPDVARLLALPLDRFAEAGQSLGVQVPWYPERLWFVPSETDAEVLAAEGVSRGRVWTAGELADLLAVPGLTKEQARTVARAKLEFAADVAEVRPAGPRSCHVCHGRDWWRSTAGRVVCRRCHPPAAPGTVARAQIPGGEVKPL